MLFRNPLDPQNVKITKAIKQWVCELWQLSEEVVISVTEMQCCGENCPHTETVITIWQQEPKVIRLPKPLTFVRKHDLIR